MIEAPHSLREDQERLHVATIAGEFDVDPRDVVEFPEGLPGFETCRHFVLLTSPDIQPVQCLHAIDGTAASFLAVDPRRALPRYRCALSPRDAARLGPADEVPLLWLALVTVDAEQRVMANLRAPVVINPTRMVGYQVVPLNTLYPLKYPISIP